MKEKSDSLHNEVTFGFFTEELKVERVIVSAYIDTIKSILFNIYNKNGDTWSQEQRDKRILSYHFDRYGKKRPTKRPGKPDEHWKYTTYNYDWSFENGHISICQYTHYLRPFNNMVVHDGISVLYGQWNCSGMASYYAEPFDNRGKY